MSVIRRLNETGDTIVEVLIALAIVSLVLTVAYSITSRNTEDVQNNAERIQGQHLVESQIELLKAKNGITLGNDCFDATGTAKPASDPTHPCDVSQVGSGATYHVRILQPSASGAPNTYTVTASWTSLRGNTASVSMVYRVKK